MESREELRPYLFAIAYRLFEIAEGVVVAVRSMLNPDKLTHIPER
jgi:hypothetical protein